tara:strand:+ start:826 stop:1065 length:240 start_codon:yes stop_codon:yes gene_type:complete
LKNFWPHRANAKGFSIENLARKYREKISDISFKKNLKELENDKNLNSLNKDSTHIIKSQISIKRVHWANRDFSEYREAA